MTGDKFKRQGKHKRGERGSIEEEENRKRLNMASEDNAELLELPDEDTNAVQEPSNLELKEMLVDIKIELTNIARENNKFAKEIAELRNLLQEQKTELDSLKTSIKKAENQNIVLEDELFTARNKINEQEEEIAELYQLQDNLEQYTRKQSLEICGIPAGAYASTEEAVLKIASALNVTMSAEDINISHKIKSKGAGTILVKFQSHKAKSRLYKARTKLKNLRLTDIFTSMSTATRVAAGTGRVFINENLTSYRKDLLRKANDKRKDGLIISAWSTDGKIFVKTSPEGAPVRIYAKEDLENL